MSGIALAWVATVTVGNQTAKQLLQFYAGHNFGKPGFEFKNATLAKQLEVTERSIRNAHKLLLDKGFLIKEERYNKEGRQLTNFFALNIPNSFVDNFMGEGEVRSSLGGKHVPGEGETSSSLINNNINNKKNREQLPDNFTPEKEHLELAKKLSVDVDYELEKFKDWAKSNGTLKLNWKATFSNWLRRSNEFKTNTQKVGRIYPVNEVRSTVPWANDNH